MAKNRDWQSAPGALLDLHEAAARSGRSVKQVRRRLLAMQAQLDAVHGAAAPRLVLPRRTKKEKIWVDVRVAREHASWVVGEEARAVDVHGLQKRVQELEKIAVGDDGGGLGERVDRLTRRTRALETIVRDLLAKIPAAAAERERWVRYLGSA